jgi:hypothetical protein
MATWRGTGLIRGRSSLIPLDLHDFGFFRVADMLGVTNITVDEGL